MANGKYQYLVYIAFDSPGIFKKNQYFSYEGVDFKLIKGTRHYQELLCTIIDIETTSGQKFEKEWDRVCNIAFKFLSSLSWEHNTGIRSVVAGGRGWHKKHGGLLKVKRLFLYPRHFHNVIMGPIGMLPKIDNELQSISLGLYREAKNADSPYYRFLCYWKILELAGKLNLKQKTWMNNTISANKWIIERADFKNKLPKTNEIAEYLETNHRNAVAHAISKRTIDPDNVEDMAKMIIGSRILEELVKIFMNKELKLDHKIGSIYNYLQLKKIKGKKIPKFVHIQT